MIVNIAIFPVKLNKLEISHCSKKKGFFYRFHSRETCLSFDDQALWPSKIKTHQEKTLFQQRQMSLTSSPFSHLEQEDLDMKWGKR